MLEHFWSWLARIRGHPGHIAFGEARNLYLGYVETLRSPIDRFAMADFEAARNNPDLLRAEALYRAAREHSAGEGQNDNVAMSDYQLGLLLHLQGRFTEAQKHLELAVEWLRASVTASAPRRSGLSGSFYHLGLLAMRRGDRGEAERLLRASLAIDEEDADSYGIALCRSAMETLATWPFDGALPDESPSANPPVASPGGLSPQQPSLGDASEGAPEPPARGRASSEGDPENGREKEEVDSFTTTSTAVVWLLSHSVAANDIYMAQLEILLARGAMTRLLVRRTAVGSADPAQSTAPRLEPDEYLYAAILVLEEEGLDHDAYLYLAKQCLLKVTELEHFRLFVGGAQAGRAVSDYKRTAGEKGKKFLEALEKVVQLVSPKYAPEKPSGSAPRPAQVRGPAEAACLACWTYLRQARAVRAAAFWRRVRMVVARSAGRLAYCSQAAAAILVGLAALAGLALGSWSALSHFVASHAATVAFLAGIVWFPVNTLPAYYLLRGMRAVARMPQERPDLARLFVAFLPASLGIGVLIDRLRLPIPWFVLGIAAGCLIDHARRVGVQERRAGVSLRHCVQWVKKHGLAETFLLRGAKLVEHPMSVALFPTLRPRVFLSYAHDTAWSAPWAWGLHDLLSEQGNVVFIDRRGIGAGSSWWSVLNRSLGEADVFVALLDAEATTREMVAAELLAALEARAKSGTPRILVLAEPTLLADRGRSKSLPVFEAVLAEPVSPESHRQVMICPGAGPALQAVANGLRPGHYETTAVVPAGWARFLQLLTLPIVTLGPLIIELPGWGAGILALLEHWERTKVGAFLERSQLLGAACLAGAYLAGFAARLLASRVFEVGGPRRGLGPFGVLALPFVGISALVFVWSKGLSPLLLGWVAVLAGAGWYLSEVFVGTVRREKPQVFGPE